MKRAKAGKLCLAIGVMSFTLIMAKAGGQTLTANLSAGTYPIAVAVNPVTNKAYVVNEASNNVTVVDGASKTTTLVAVGTNPSSIAVNPLTNKVYVGNFGSNNMTVIDGGTGSTQTVSTGQGPTGLAVDTVTNKIYVANAGGNSVTVIDGATNITSLVAAGLAPRSVAVNPVTNKIYVANAVSNNVTVIDGLSNATTTVAAGTTPTSVAVNPVTNKVYVANNASNNLTIINGANGSATNVAVGTNPTMVAVNAVTNKIYVANQHSNNVTVIDGGSGSVAATVAAGTNTSALALNSSTNLIFASNGISATITVIDGASNLAIASLPTGANPGPMAVNPVTNEIYVANNGDGVHASSATVISGATYSTTALTSAGNAFSVAVNPVTNKIYVPNSQTNQVTVIDGATNSSVNVPVGMDPYVVAVNPVTNKIYVGNYYDINMTVIDGATNHTTNVAVGIGAFRIAVNEVTNKIYVAANSFVVVDGATNGTVTLAVSGNDMVVNQATNKIYLDSEGELTIVDGGTNEITHALLDGGDPFPMAIDTIRNKIYVGYVDDRIGVIDGFSNSEIASVPIASNPRAIAVNPISNKIYVATFMNVTVIAGATNTVTATPAAGPSGAFLLQLNPVTNKIYAANDAYPNPTNILTVIDGSTNSTTSVKATLGPMALNPVTNRLYLVSESSTAVTVVNEQQLEQVPLTTSITPLANNEAPMTKLNFTFVADSTTVTIPDGVYFQADTWQNTWSRAPGSNPDFAGTLATLQPGFHILYAYASDGQEATATQPASPLTGDIQAYGFLVTPAVQYLGLDTATQGTWNGQYGGDGYLIANDASSLPAYAAVSFAGVATYTWAGQTSDIRGLQTAAGANSRIASAYIPSTNSNSFKINLNLSDGSVHRVALYLLDWDTASRTETVTITDAGTNTVLDFESFYGFHNGQYGVWNLTGNLVITVTSSVGSPVLSGLFFGPAGPPSKIPVLASSASFIGIDTTSEGTWTSHYGRDGYQIANGVSSLPPYAGLGIQGDFSYTWANSTLDPRALQVYAGSTSRIASTYAAYYETSFTIDANLGDGKVHQIALYLLDWDTSSRTETISILDAATNTVLSTQSFSGFHNGEYAIWNVKGNVIIKATPSSGSSSAVVSGIFFN